MIDGILDSIQKRISDAFAGVFDYVFLAEWYVLGLALLAACVVIGYFAPFKWARAFLGFLLAMMAAFLAGLQVMFNRTRRENKSLRDENRALKKKTIKDWWQ